MSDQKAKRFTIDDDKTGAKVPDINQLLYAKSPSKSQGSKPDESLDPTVSMDISKANLEEITRQSDVIAAPPKQSSYSVESSTSDNTALQTAGKEIEMGDFDQSLAIEAGTAAAPPKPQAPAPEIVLQTATPPASPPKRFANPVTGEVVMSSFQKSASSPAGTPTGAPKAAIRKSALTTATGAPLKQTDAANLNSHLNTISYAAGIKTFFERAKATSVIVFNKTDSGFVADQVVGAPERANLWRGMQIAEKDLSDLYNRLNKYGYSEFSTLGMSGAGNFERTGFRTAFGADRSEFLTLVKVGSGKEMEAIVVVLSSASIQTQIPFFHSALMGTSSMRKAA